MNANNQKTVHAEMFDLVEVVRTIQCRPSASSDKRQQSTHSALQHCGTHLKKNAHLQTHKKKPADPATIPFERPIFVIKLRQNDLRVVLCMVLAVGEAKGPLLQRA